MSEHLRALATTAVELESQTCPVCNKQIRGLVDRINRCDRAFRIRKLRAHSMENHHLEPIWETVKCKRRQRGGSASDMVDISMCSAVSHMPLPHEAPTNIQGCIERNVASRFGWSRCWIYCGQVNFLERRKDAKQRCHGPVDMTGKASKARTKCLRNEAVVALYTEGEKVQRLLESKAFRESIRNYSWDRIVNKINLIFVLGVEKGGIPFVHLPGPIRNLK
jgi:hypothetical protein